MWAGIFTIREESYKYGKGKNQNKLCHSALELDISLWTHSFQRSKYRSTDAEVFVCVLLVCLNTYIP